MATKITKPKTKRGRKQDADRVSNQPSEIKYAAKKNKVSQKKVRGAKKKVGVSRKKINKELSENK